jgi:hypothetical protein
MAGSNISPRPYRELAHVNDGLDAHASETHARGGAR